MTERQNVKGRNQTPMEHKDREQTVQFPPHLKIKIKTEIKIKITKKDKGKDEEGTISTPHGLNCFIASLKADFTNHVNVCC